MRWGRKWSLILSLFGGARCKIAMNVFSCESYNQRELVRVDEYYKNAFE